VPCAAAETEDLDVSDSAIGAGGRQ